MSTTLIAVAALVIQAQADGEAAEVTAARLFYQMDFGDMASCERAVKNSGKTIERHLEETMRERFAASLNAGTSFRVDTAATCRER